MQTTLCDVYVWKVLRHGLPKISRREVWPGGGEEFNNLLFAGVRFITRIIIIIVIILTSSRCSDTIPNIIRYLTYFIYHSSRLPHVDGRLKPLKFASYTPTCTYAYYARRVILCTYLRRPTGWSVQNNNNNNNNNCDNLLDRGYINDDPAKPDHRVADIHTLYYR